MASSKGQFKLNFTSTRNIGSTVEFSISKTQDSISIENSPTFKALEKDPSRVLGMVKDQGLISNSRFVIKEAPSKFMLERGLFDLSYRTESESRIKRISAAVIADSSIMEKFHQTAVKTVQFSVNLD